MFSLSAILPLHGPPAGPTEPGSHSHDETSSALRGREWINLRELRQRFALTSLQYLTHRECLVIMPRLTSPRQSWKIMGTSDKCCLEMSQAGSSLEGTACSLLLRPEKTLHCRRKKENLCSPAGTLREAGTKCSQSPLARSCRNSENTLYNAKCHGIRNYIRSSDARCWQSG